MGRLEFEPLPRRGIESPERALYNLQVRGHIMAGHEPREPRRCCTSSCRGPRLPSAARRNNNVVKGSPPRLLCRGHPHSRHRGKIRLAGRRDLVSVLKSRDAVVQRRCGVEFPLDRVCSDNGRPAFEGTRRRDGVDVVHNLHRNLNNCPPASPTCPRSYARLDNCKSRRHRDISGLVGRPGQGRQTTDTSRLDVGGWGAPA